MQWNVRDLEVVRGAEHRLTLNRVWTYFESDIIIPAKKHVEPECRRRKFSVDHITVAPFRNEIPQLYIDRELMTQVVFNIFENAIKYAIDDPVRFQVRVIPRTRPDGSYEIRFVDDGRGVPIGFEEKIFEESYRHVDVLGIPGDGLGLAVARKLVEMHCGELTCVHRDVGSEFVIRLPRY